MQWRRRRMVTPKSMVEMAPIAASRRRRQLGAAISMGHRLLKSAVAPTAPGDVRDALTAEATILPGFMFAGLFPATCSHARSGTRRNGTRQCPFLRCSMSRMRRGRFPPKSACGISKSMAMSTTGIAGPARATVVQSADWLPGCGQLVFHDGRNPTRCKRPEFGRIR